MPDPIQTIVDEPSAEPAPMTISEEASRSPIESPSIPSEPPVPAEAPPQIVPMIEPLTPTELRRYDSTNIDRCIGKLIEQRDRQSSIFQARIDELIALREKLITENA